MNKWAVRGLLFVSLFVAPAALNALSAAGPVGADIDATVIHLLASRGLPYRQSLSFSGGSLRALVFELPGCSEPLQIALTNREFEARDLFDKVGGPGAQRLFAYLDKVSSEEGGSWTLREAVKYRLLELISLSPYQVDRSMLLISTPHGCEVPHLDWSQVWNKEYRRSVERLADSSK